uniref:Uncharacterized protein n=1 Tax=Arundo donax TaxID=35708 RepID=A0A0A9BLN5_ARUDO
MHSRLWLGTTTSSTATRCSWRYRSCSRVWR